MNQDDEIRTQSGVVCCLRKIGSNQFTLIFDDVINEKETTSGVWKHEVVFTWKDIKTKEIENLTESE